MHTHPETGSQTPNPRPALQNPPPPEPEGHVPSQVGPNAPIVQEPQRSSPLHAASQEQETSERLAAPWPPHPAPLLASRQTRASTTHTSENDSPVGAPPAKPTPPATKTCVPSFESTTAALARGAHGAVKRAQGPVAARATKTALDEAMGAPDVRCAAHKSPGEKSLATQQPPLRVPRTYSRRPTSAPCAKALPGICAKPLVL